MKITAKYHVTATEKRHIKEIIERKNEFLENGVIKAGTKRKFYEIVETEFGFEGVIKTPEKDDCGRPVTRKQSFCVVV